MFCPICESSVEEDDGEDERSVGEVLYQKISRNTDQQKFNFLFV